MHLWTLDLQVGKNILFSINGVEAIKYLYKNMKLDSYITLYRKTINSIYIHDFGVRKVLSMRFLKTLSIKKKNRKRKQHGEKRRKSLRYREKLMVLAS